MNKVRSWWRAASRRKKISTVVIAVVIIIIILIAKKHGTSTVQSATVTRSNVVNTVVLSGSTESASAVSLGFASQGRVASVLVKEGAKVHAGQVLATLDTADLQASLKNARAALVIAQANNANTTANLSTITAQQNTLVQNAKNALYSNHLEADPANLTTSAPAPTISGTYTGDAGQYIVHVYPSGTNSGASFNISGIENGFTQEAASSSPVPLGSKGLYIQFAAGYTYSKSDWIVNIPNTHSSTYTADKNAYDAAVAARTQAITAAQNDIANSNNAGSVAAAQIEQARAQVDSVLAQIAQREIIAPFDGVISSVNVKPGQTTNSFNPSSSTTDSANANISMISENDYEVVLKTPEIDVASIAVGQPVSMTLDAFGTETFPGSITSIDPAETIVDGVPVYQTKVAFTTLDPRIRSGMTATATIVVGEKDNVTAIPVSFVHSSNSGSYVYVLQGKHTYKQAVTTGLRGSDSTVEISSGLTPGQTIESDPQ
ncbi:MAG TPA: efflux RND transporter periplasmic adaptor subunit [Candidatus Paceibacterota bacterium]|jgi:RND family efflux transporter MFP subunit|nr:efflux RND transporter periplasmic adaptor subunit [Candidatus Paceibacterota bacterium]